MKSVFYSHARNNLRAMIDKVCLDFEEFVITTKDGKSVALISYDEYSAMKETLYLLSSKTNRERLMEAVEQIDTSKFQTKDIDV